MTDNYGLILFFQDNFKRVLLYYVEALQFSKHTRIMCSNLKARSYLQYSIANKSDTMSTNLVTTRYHAIISPKSLKIYRKRISNFLVFNFFNLHYTHV